MPVIGIRFNVMPTFSRTCVNQLASNPNATRLLNESLARSEIANDAQEEEQKERQRDRHADEAELFADYSEDEVGVLLRKKREALLRTMQVSRDRTSRPSRSRPATE